MYSDYIENMAYNIIFHDVGAFMGYILNLSDYLSPLFFSLIGISLGVSFIRLATR